MWGKKNNEFLPKSKIKIDSYIGKETAISGDISFRGGLHIEGSVTGTITALDQDAILILNEEGMIEGDVNVPYLILDGKITGHVTSNERVELAQHSRISGDLYYQTIEMAVGAEVNGTLIHHTEKPPSDEPTLDNVEENSLTES